MFWLLLMPRDCFDLHPDAVTLTVAKTAEAGQQFRALQSASLYGDGVRPPHENLFCYRLHADIDLFASREDDLPQWRYVAGMVELFLPYPSTTYSPASGL